MKKYILLICVLGIVITGCQSSKTHTKNTDIIILHTNDTHSQLEPYNQGKDSEQGGVLRRMEYIRQMREEYETVFLFDAGDFSQGTPYYNLFHGYPEIWFMNQQKYDAATFGNHEFDDGVHAFADRVKIAQFPIICSNYTFKDSLLCNLIKPYTIIERNGTKIGVFGLVIDLHGLSNAPNLMDTIEYHDAIQVAKEMTQKLKEEQCDLIVCLSHLGFTPDDTTPDNLVCDTLVARQVQDIDIIIGGHTHVALSQPVQIGRVQIVQNKNQGRTIGCFRLSR